MQRKVKHFMAVLTTIALAASLIGCSGGTASEGKDTEGGSTSAIAATKQAEEIKLTLWTNVHVMSDSKNKTEDEWYINKAIKRFEENNPGVTIEVSVPPDSQQVHQMFKAAAMAKNGPDICNLWSGMAIFSMKDAIYPITDLVPEEDLKNITGWDFVTYEDEILGYPAAGLDAGFFFYNKKIISDLGMDFEKNPPKTTEEFYNAMQKIKDAGIIPIASDEGKWPTIFTSVGEVWLEQREEGYGSLQSSAEGKTKFEDNIYFLDAFKYYSSLYTKGFINQDAASSTDALNKFVQGEAALYPEGSWGLSEKRELLGENLGVLAPPNISSDAVRKDRTVGGVGQSMVVANYCKHPETAVKLLSFLSSKEELLEYYKIEFFMPLRNDITTKEMGWDTDNEMTKIFQWTRNPVAWMDAMISQDIYSEIVQYAPVVLTGKMTPEEMGRKLDEKVEQLK